MFMGSIPDPWILTYHTVLKDSDGWTMTLGNVQVGTEFLGYNGAVQVIINSPYHVLPKSAFYSLVEFLQIPDLVVAAAGELNLGTFSCSDSVYNNLLNVTYWAGGAPLLLTKEDWVIRTGNTCTFGFAYLGDAPAYAPHFWSLGWLFMVNRNVTFDFSEVRIGVTDHFSP